MIEQNSLDAYRDLIDTGSLGEKQLSVFNYIRSHPNCTYNEISRALNMHHNTCTARIKELRDLGFIIKSGDVIDPYTEKRNGTYRVRRTDEHAEIPKQPLMTIPRAMADAIIRIIDNHEHGTQYVYNTNYGLYKVESNHGMATFGIVGMFWFNDISNYCELNSQKEFMIEGLGFNFVFRLK